MGTLKLNNVTALTESGGTVVLDSAVAGIPAAGITGTIPSGVSLTSATFPSGHIIRTYHHEDTNNATYGADQHPLGGSSGLRIPASGTNITTSVTNSKFLLIAQVSSSWGGDHSGSWTVQGTDWGLYLQRNNVSGTSTTRIGGVDQASARGGDNTWYGNDDGIRGYNPLDTRSFMLTHLDSPNCAAGSTLYYSVGLSGTFESNFPYNRTGKGSANGTSASTLIVYEIAP